MIRVVLTVLVAVALLATATPALEDARTATTVERLDSEADRVERAVGGLVSGSVSVADPSLAARATVTVDVPSGFAAAPVDRVALAETDGGSEADTTETEVALRYRIDGGPKRTVPIAPGGAGSAVAVDGGAVALRPGGESRLALRFVDDGGPTVRIARVG